MVIRSGRLLYFLAIIKFILPFLLQHPVYEPHRDELLYLAEGQHMAWGFMEVPPLLSVFAWLTNLMGDGMFWIKCWPSLFGALTFYVTGKIILSLGGRNYAIFMAFLAFVLTGYLRVHFLFQPNFLEIFFWTMIAYALIRYTQEKKDKWLYVFGLSVGLGMMSKYSVSFMVFAVLLGLLMTKQRTIFQHKRLYMAGLLAFLIFLPNLLWQWMHHFPVLHHMKELQETQLQYLSPVGFLVDQLIMLAPCAFIWIVGLWMLSFSAKEKAYRFIGFTYFLIILLLLLGRGKSYYSLGIYPCLIAFGATQLERYFVGRIRWLRYALVILPLALAYYVIPVALPIMAPEKLARFYEKTNMKKMGVLKWEDQKNHPLPQDFSDMLGWEEMAQKMAKAYATLDSTEKKNTILFCDNYGQAGAVNYYGKKYGLPPTYSDNASFLYWMPDTLQITNLVLLTDDEQEMDHKFVKEFSSAQLIDSISNPYARERGDLVIVLKGANQLFNRYFREKITKKKAELNEH
jgi:Dolichyl-phosphate-mannose-protein mannosyltransferase